MQSLLQACSPRVLDVELQEVVQVQRSAELEDHFRFQHEQTRALRSILERPQQADESVLDEYCAEVNAAADMPINVGDPGET